ncbi:MAG: type II toxin-antitoxin system VapC family toxin [Syntrophales bacterium]|nr:type II toxin-antitoxin system VapC family toxin [Syntrophales bacterium]MDD5642550.1 type II toxin-antitoxin system VapC family toxin [Syntrophales bacterium]
MNLVDSCGWLEYFADGPNADFYAPALEDPGSLLVPTICLLEVFKSILPQRGEDAALQAAAAMHRGLLAPLDATLALRASRIGHDLHLPLADSVILATARAYGSVIWTQDIHFQGLAGVRYTDKR